MLISRFNPFLTQSRIKFGSGRKDSNWDKFREKESKEIKDIFGYTVGTPFPQTPKTQLNEEDVFSSSSSNPSSAQASDVEEAELEMVSSEVSSSSETSEEESDSNNSSSSEAEDDSTLHPIQNVRKVSFKPIADSEKEFQTPSIDIGDAGNTHTAKNPFAKYLPKQENDRHLQALASIAEAEYHLRSYLQETEMTNQSSGLTTEKSSNHPSSESEAEKPATLSKKNLKQKGIEKTRKTSTTPKRRKTKVISPPVKKLASKKNTYTPEEKDYAMKLFTEEKKTQKEIIEITKIPQGTLSTWGIGTGRAQRQYTEAEKRKALKLFEKGKTQEEIVDITGFPKGTLSRWGITKTDKKRKNLTQQEKTKAQKLFRQGKRQKEIARILKRPQQTLSKIGIGTGKTKKRYTEEEKANAKKLFFEKGKTQQQITELTGMSPATLLKLGITKTAGSAKKNYTEDEKQQAKNLFSKEKKTTLGVHRMTKIPLSQLAEWGIKDKPPLKRLTRKK